MLTNFESFGYENSLKLSLNHDVWINSNKFKFLDFTKPNLSKGILINE